MRENLWKFIWFILFGALVSSMILIGRPVSEALAVFMAYCLGGLTVVALILPAKPKARVPDMELIRHVTGHYSNVKEDAEVMCQGCPGVATTQNNLCSHCYDPRRPFVEGQLNGH